MTRTLFEIGDDLRALALLMNDCDAELTRETSEALDEWFAELARDEAHKLDGYVGLIRTLEMEEAKAKEEAERFLMAARVRGNNVRRLKDRVKDYIAASGRTKVVTAAGRTLAVTGNGGHAPILLPESLDPASIPDEFAIVRRTPDIDAIREHLTAGGSLPFATLGSRGNHLRIR